MLIVMIMPEPRDAAMRMAAPAARMRRIFLVAGFMEKLSFGCSLVSLGSCRFDVSAGCMREGRDHPSRPLRCYQRSSDRNVMAFVPAVPFAPPCRVASRGSSLTPAVKSRGPHLSWYSALGKASTGLAGADVREYASKHRLLWVWSPARRVYYLFSTHIDGGWSRGQANNSRCPQWPHIT